jgi:hypothetical protein
MTKCASCGKEFINGYSVPIYNFITTSHNNLPLSIITLYYCKKCFNSDMKRDGFVRLRVPMGLLGEK